MINITEIAQGKLKEIMAENKAPHMRIYALDRTHSTYELAFEWNPKRTDLVFDVEGISFVADDITKDYLQGLTIDYEDNDDEVGFTIHSTLNTGCGALACDHGFGHCSGDGECNN
ncbi:hypothetical protein F9B85_13415 [Heliorestis acidaminivorans]|uniref:Core domain-containing protein n=1 Tax=Heliorestis acidaminivorans TaxID=553427 RepID=A0A6I0EZN3_9FIRM|nr:iron-sulfur cluster biosynthesis family protein [Heliorestis acidaminivorans]KAB2951198.1 hypothetical protein F9B85_13415 [Heliorestis acidaminivorans]